MGKFSLDGKGEAWERAFLEWDPGWILADAIMLCGMNILLFRCLVPILVMQEWVYPQQQLFDPFLF
jgi:hypothetical protein